LVAHVLIKGPHRGGASLGADAKWEREMASVGQAHRALTRGCVPPIRATPCIAPSALKHFPTLLWTRAAALTLTCWAPALHSIRTHGEGLTPTVNAQPTTASTSPSMRT